MKNIIMMIKKMMIKKMIKKVWNFFENLGCVRAADSLARQGFHEEAEVLMLAMLIKEANIKLERMKKLELEQAKETKFGYNPLKHYFLLAFSSPFVSIDFGK
ncbi:MAG: hypothetical protein HVK32_03605 [Pelagibacteraceae bacterium]|jgi:alcohol dehydrogenase YqhD (iron-dependent ADH family)|nr:hypothetical protein [Pelagibacteraceae bacterium]